MGQTRRTMMLVATMVSLAACGGGRQQNTAGGDVNGVQSTPAQPNPGYSTGPETTTTTHHSKLKGALVGGIVGHYAGGHALAGAAAGALVQHERNKHHH